MTFKNWNDFENFKEHVRFESRYVHSSNAREFLENVKESFLSRIRTLPKYWILYRSQIGYSELEHKGEHIVVGYPKERMKPLLRGSTEGRANPKGISYLYLSGDPGTSMAELRPSRGQKISCAEFQVIEDLKLIDCYGVSNNYSLARCLFEPPKNPKEIEDAVWSRINEEFSKPISNSDVASDYVATQILTELVKSCGYDGICFKSSLESGYNVVLFDLNKANLISCTVNEIKEVKLYFSECANRYFVTS
ncbi:RES family NAD+ phosphorylase [Duganella sp. Dugasp56]|uniref:RES family NAD+ phosphorylase n=1 Tax=Duganella sp. Dugasp56 TaxID=3243046 RepID=UPI0039B0F3AD